jgi:CO dehydrogenase nickel-insertion accessory protein CooC1
MNVPDGTTNVDAWLGADRESVAEAIRITNARDDKVTRDTCSCGGEGCACTVEPFVRKALTNQRPRLR